VNERRREKRQSYSGLESFCRIQLPAPNMPGVVWCLEGGDNGAEHIYRSYAFLEEESGGAHVPRSRVFWVFDKKGLRQGRKETMKAGIRVL
jgi:hypothetical protein